MADNQRPEHVQRMHDASKRLAHVRQRRAAAVRIAAAPLDLKAALMDLPVPIGARVLDTVTGQEGTVINGRIDRKFSTASAGDSAQAAGDSVG